MWYLTSENLRSRAKHALPWITVALMKASDFIRASLAIFIGWQCGWNHVVHPLFKNHGGALCL